MSKKLQRTNKIIEILREKNGASVKELSSILNVSEMTIRRDLDFLKKNNIINKIYGGSIYNPNNNIESLKSFYDIEHEVIKQESEKVRIAKAACNLIKENDVIIIDAGTTTQKVAENINDNITITALVFSTNILNPLLNKNNIKLIFSGGYYHNNTKMFESPEGVSLIQKTRANKVFVSAAGIHETLGITCSNSYEILTKNAIMNSSIEKILLADSKKFSIVKPAYFADLSEFTTIITDNNLSKEWQSKINDLGITLILV